MKPSVRPRNPNFSSGPTSKRPGWSIANLETASLGRSHRAALPKSRLEKVIACSREILDMPPDYVLGIVPASDTGAFEIAMWSLLGERGVEIFAWESFGQGWVNDCKNQLHIADLIIHEADYGQLPDLSAADCNNDIIFTWNGTTSGVKIPDANWIDADRTGLTLCDATSAVFAMDIDWPKLDVVTWSWQKALGGEGAHGMLALSPRALDRLESYQPDRPLPKVFRLTKGGKVMREIFAGSTINTPSLLAVEDQIDALTWASSLGLQGLIKRSEDNLYAVSKWVARTPWIDFLAKDERTRSNTSICLSVIDPRFQSLDRESQSRFVKVMVSMLEEQQVAYDIGGYRDAPPGLRIWGGGTVESTDIEALLPWLDWAFRMTREQAA